jgi:predicted nucleotidyltransferase component of viral defense system
VFVQALPEGARRNLALLGTTGIVEPYYLAGGTAMALYLGHRVSVDLDFFRPTLFDPMDLAGRLAQLGQFRLEQQSADTLLGELEGIKVSFFRYRYPLIGETSAVLGVAVAGLEDLVAMKLDAISRRGTRRDFIDLYFAAQSSLSLSEALQCYSHKYAEVNVDPIHVVKSLAYFVDAETEPMPQMLTSVSWEAVRRFFEEEARSLFRSL